MVRLPGLAAGEESGGGECRGALEEAGREEACWAEAAVLQLLSPLARHAAWTCKRAQLQDRWQAAHEGCATCLTIQHQPAAPTSSRQTRRGS